MQNMPYVHHVKYYETDQMKIVHHSNYIRWMEEARMDYMDRLGWGYRMLEDMGIVSPVLSAGCQYENAVRFDDTVEIHVRLKKYNGLRLWMTYEMYCKETGKLTTRGETCHCFLDTEGRPLILRKRFPEFDRILRGEVEKEPCLGQNT